MNPIVEDVYVAYGRTMHAVQRLERASLNIRGFIRTALSKENTAAVEVTRSLLDEAIDYVSKLPGRQKTLSKTFQELYRERMSGGAFDTILTETKTFRDRLAHSFIADADLKTAEGCRLAIEELHAKESYFHNMAEATIETFREAVKKTSSLPEPLIGDLIAAIDPGGPERKLAD